jgi:hypothetical protein
MKTQSALSFLGLSGAFLLVGLGSVILWSTLGMVEEK